MGERKLLIIIHMRSKNARAEVIKKLASKMIFRVAMPLTELRKTISYSRLLFIKPVF